MQNKLRHQPVLVDEVISYIKPEKNKIYFDGTFGQGGYTKKILKEYDCKIFAIDRDPESLKYANELKRKKLKSFEFEVEKLSNFKNCIHKKGIMSFDGIMLDLGVSNTQLNNPVRGFSFSNDGPLDMRMNNNSDKLTAEKIVNEFSENKLSDIFYYFGEEKNSRKISKLIINYREKKRISSTVTLSKIIEEINFQKKIHPATRVFQALRIFVNSELDELENFLHQSINHLNKNSRIAIVTFHSLEDRIVKHFFKSRSSNNPNNYKHYPEKKVSKNQLKIITKKTIRPSLREINENPRSRSAKLRVAEKL